MYWITATWQIVYTYGRKRTALLNWCVGHILGRFLQNVNFLKNEKSFYVYLWDDHIRSGHDQMQQNQKGFMIFLIKFNRIWSLYYIQWMISYYLHDFEQCYDQISNKRPLCLIGHWVTAVWLLQCIFMYIVHLIRNHYFLY